MKRRHVMLGASGTLLMAGAFGIKAFRSPDPFRTYVGMAAPEKPVQVDLPQAVLVEHPAADLILFATFSLTALVLSARSYRDDMAVVSPLDLALGWGPSSDPSRIKDIRYWQENRWYVYASQTPVSTEMRHSSSNMHMIPAHPDLHERLRTIKTGDLVQVSGHLCDIRFPNKPEILSSRQRTDKDAGACEIVYVETLSVLT